MRLVCFGDSNTYGYDPRGFFGDRYAGSDRWPELLAKHSGFEVLNCGSNGRSIPRNASGVFPDAGETVNDIFIVMLGTNDLLQGASAAEAARRMEVFLNSAKSRFAGILLVSPPPMQRGAWVPNASLTEESLKLAEEYKLLSEKLSIFFADTRDWKTELAYDGVHLTEQGHHTFAGCMQKQLAGLFRGMR